MNLSQIITEDDFDACFDSEIWAQTARQICLRHKISFTELKRADGSDHIVFLIDDRFVLKIFRPFRHGFEREKKALEFIAPQISLKVPEIIQTSQFEQFNYIITEQISGSLVTRQDWLLLSEKAQTSFIIELANGLKEIHRLNPISFSDDWADFVKDRAETFVKRQIANNVNQQIIKVLPKYIEESLSLVPTNSPNVFMHSDIHFGNLRVFQKNNCWQIAGLFDFGDSRRGFYEYEFLAVGVLMIQGQPEIQREFFKGYGYHESELNETMRKRLMMLTMLYETADLRRYALRLSPQAVNFSLDELEKGIWSFVK